MRKLTMLAITSFTLTACGVAEHLGNNCGGDLKELCYNVFGGRTDNQQNTEIDGLKNRIDSLESQLSSFNLQLKVLDSAMSSQASNIGGQLANIKQSIHVLQNNDADIRGELILMQQDIETLKVDLNLLQSSVGIIGSSANALRVDVIALQTEVAQLNALAAYAQSLVPQAISEYNQIKSAIAALQAQMSVVDASLVGVTDNVTTLQNASNATLTQLATLQGYKSIVGIHDPCGPQGAYNEVFLKLSDGTYLASFSDNDNGKNTRFAVLEDGDNLRTTDGTNCYFTVSDHGTVISNEHN